jgi:hypothetical protein
MAGSLEDKKEACKTFLEQTKLLVTLASAFLLAPAAIVGISSSDPKLSVIRRFTMPKLIIAEILFIASILCGYIVLGTIAGEQHGGTYNVYRAATRVSSILQLALYVVGLIFFVIVVKAFL